MSKSDLRRTLRKKRQSLSRAEQHQASVRLSRKLIKHPAFLRAKNIALYMPADGEISPLPLLNNFFKLGKHIYLPSITVANSLEFRRYRGTRDLEKNRYGIWEPKIYCEKIDTHLLELVILPLVGVDTKGNRLGMGAGYYDRSFAFKRKFPKRGPHLMGLAHHCQLMDRIPTEHNDIPLDYVATDKKMINVERA